MDKTKQIRFLELRQRLSEHKYDETLGSIESMDLVEHLLTDLINTTNSYKIVCDKEARLTSDLNLAQAQLFPLRKENARLDRENHDLHRDQINQNDVMRATVDEYNRKIRAIEHEHGHLKLVVAAKDKLINDNEVHLKRIREAYSTVVDPKGSTPSKRVLKISNNLSLNASVAGGSGSILLSPGASTAQRPSAADTAALETLRSQVDILSAALKKSEDEVKRLNTAIASREQELSRSGKLLSLVSSNYIDTSDNGGIMPSNRQEQLLAADVANKRIIDQLNGQVDFLNEELAKSQQELRQVGDKLRSFEAVQMELSQRTMLLDQARKETAQMSSKLRMMEQKLIDSQLAIDQQQQQQRLKLSSTASVASFAVPETNNDNRHNEEEHRTLLSKIASLTAEKEEVTSEVLRLQQVIEEFDRKQSASTLNTWKQGVKGAKEKSEVLIGDLNKEIEEKKKRVSQLTKQLTQSEDRNKVLLAEKDELAKKVKFLEKTRNQSDVLRQNGELTETVTRLEVVRDALQKELQQLRGTSELTLQELTALRRQYSDLVQEKEQLSITSAFSNSEVTACKAALQEHVTLLSEQREQVTRLTIELQDAKVAGSSAEQKYQLLKSQLDSLQLTLQQQQTQLLSASQTLAVNRSESGGSSTLIEQLLADKKQLQSQVTQLELEQQKTEVHRSSLQQVVSYLGLQQSEHEGRLVDASEERMRILHALRDKDAEIDGLKVQLQQMHQDVSHKSEGLAHTDSAIRSLREDYVTSRQVNEQQASRINQLISDLQLSGQRLQYAEGERDQLTEQLEELLVQSQRTADQLSVVRQEYQIVQGQLQQLERERELLQQSVVDGQLQSEQVQRRARSGQQDYQNVLKSKSELEARIEEYKVLLVNAENTQRSHTQKAELLTGRLRASEAQETQLEHEIDSLKAALNEREGQIKDLEELVQQLDRERDSLQEQLDENEDQEVLRSQVTKTQEVKLLQSQQLIDQLNQKLTAVTKELSAVSKQCASTEARLNAMQMENGNLRRRCEEMQQDVELGSKDLVNMTRETQVLSSDVHELSQDRDRLRVRVSELMNSLTASDQLRRALEIERNDLMETYRSVLQEKRRVEHELANMSAMKQQDNQASQKLFEEVGELHAAMNAMKNNERTWINDKLALSKQLELLNDQLLRVNARLSEVEEERLKALQDSLGLQQTNALLNDRINKVIQRATAATEANKMLTSTLSAVERERDAVKSLVQIERQRATEMGQLVQEARTQAATKDLQLQSLRTKSSSNLTSTLGSESEVIQTAITSTSSSSATASHTVVSRTTTSVATSSTAVNASQVADSSSSGDVHLAHTHSD